MKIKSDPQGSNGTKNTMKENNKTTFGNRNYVSGEPAPSSANHKFQDRKEASENHR